MERGFAKAMGCGEAYKALKSMAYGIKADQDPARACNGGDKHSGGSGVPKPFGGPLICMLQRDMQTADRMVQLAHCQKGKEVCRVVNPQSITSPYSFLKPTYGPSIGGGKPQQAQGNRGGNYYGKKFAKGNDGSPFVRRLQ
tara:strand:- start:348 stop:770 length:423 start_codon:yes stop_codon:yes gene_type:complete